MGNPLAPLFETPPTAMSALKLDAMYYHAALQMFHNAARRTRAVARAHRAFEKVEAAIDKVLEKHDGDVNDAPDLEPLGSHVKRYDSPSAQ